jgi:hypothetical protein
VVVFSFSKQIPISYPKIALGHFFNVFSNFLLFNHTNIA